jgi:hypothetical protein
MPSKLMKRKIAWARQYGAEVDAKIKVIQVAQRASFGVESGEDKRLLALSRGMLEADKRFQIVAIKDGRNPGNQRQSHEAHKRLERARAAYARYTGREPNEYGSYWGYRDAIDEEIDALVERLRTTST